MALFLSNVWYDFRTYRRNQSAVSKSDFVLGRLAFGDAQAYSGTTLRSWCSVVFYASALQLLLVLVCR